MLLMPFSPCTRIIRCFSISTIAQPRYQRLANRYLPLLNLVSPAELVSNTVEQTTL